MTDHFPPSNWIPVKDFEELYEVNKNGDIRHKGKTVLRVLKLNHPEGYLRVLLCNRKKKVSAFVHRIVAHAFLKRQKGREYVNHKNGIKTDNRIENLEWCTRSENQKHAYETGLMPSMKGVRNPRAVLTEEQVLRIRKEYREGQGLETIGRKYKIHGGTAGRVAKKISWKHI